MIGEQCRSWSDYADAQADPNPYGLHNPTNTFSHERDNIDVDNIYYFPHADVFLPQCFQLYLITILLFVLYRLSTDVFEVVCEDLVFMGKS